MNSAVYFLLVIALVKEQVVTFDGSPLDSAKQCYLTDLPNNPGEMQQMDVNELPKDVYDFLVDHLAGRGVNIGSVVCVLAFPAVPDVYKVQYQELQAMINKKGPGDFQVYDWPLFLI